MVFNTFIKCQVCGSITRIRLQVGWQEEHPIEVACGKCVRRCHFDAPKGNRHCHEAIRPWSCPQELRGEV